MRKILGIATASLLGVAVAAQAPTASYDPATMVRAGSPHGLHPAVAKPSTGSVALLGIPGLLGSEVVADVLLDVNPANGSTTVIGKLGDPVVAALAWDPILKVLYGTSTGSHSLLTIDPVTGATKVVGPFGVTVFMHGLAFNLRTRTLYAANSFGSNQLFTVNPATGAATAVGAHGLSGLGDLAYDFLTDTMYAADAGGKALYTLDLKTGAATRVGPFGTGRQIGTGLAFDFGVGLFAADNKASSTADDELYRIDTTTGAATLIGPMNAGNVLGLAFLDTCLPAIARSYGQGFPGTSGVPTLTATKPVIGQSFTLTLSNSRGVATPGWLVVGAQPAAIPMFWGGTVHVDLLGAVLLSMQIPAGGLVLPLSLPGNAPCTSLYSQTVLVDLGARLGLSNSAGLELRVGL